MTCRRKSIITRILQRVRIDESDPDSCWIWTGPTSGNGRGGGYPRMCLNGQTVAVHRVVFTHFFGYIPGRKQIDHTCRNRMCVNPYHLEMTTHRENQRRRDAARRENEMECANERADLCCASKRKRYTATSLAGK